MCTLRTFININESAQKKAWNPKNNHGAKNKKVNSIGSVTPVINEVTAAGKTTAIAT